MINLGLDRYHAGARYLILDTIGRSCTDTDTDTATGNDVPPHSLRQTYVTYIAHSIRTFQNITSLTSWTAAYLLLSATLQECISYSETNYRLDTIGVHATVSTVKTGERTTGIGRYYNKCRLIPTDTRRYRLIPDTGISLTLVIIHLVASVCLYFSCSNFWNSRHTYFINRCAY